MHRTMCLDKFLGLCPKCTPDIDPNHHPNNLDCPRYQSVIVVFAEVEEKKCSALEKS